MSVGGGRCRDWYLTPPRDSFLDVEVAGGSGIICLACLPPRPRGAKQMEGEGGVSEFLQQLV